MCVCAWLCMYVFVFVLLCVCVLSMWHFVTTLQHALSGTRYVKRDLRTPHVHQKETYTRHTHIKQRPAI